MVIHAALIGWVKGATLQLLSNSERLSKVKMLFS